MVLVGPTSRPTSDYINLYLVITNVNALIQSNTGLSIGLAYSTIIYYGCVYFLSTVSIPPTSNTGNVVQLYGLNQSTQTPSHGGFYLNFPNSIGISPNGSPMQMCHYNSDITAYHIDETLTFSNLESMGNISYCNLMIPPPNATYPCFEIGNSNNYTSYLQWANCGATTSSVSLNSKNTGCSSSNGNTPATCGYDCETIFICDNYEAEQGE